MAPVKSAECGPTVTFFGTQGRSGCSTVKSIVREGKIGIHREQYNVAADPSSYPAISRFLLSVAALQSIVGLNPHEEKKSVLTRAKNCLSGLLLSLLVVVAGCGSIGGPQGGGAHDDYTPVQWPGELGSLSTERSDCDVLSGDASPQGEFTFGLTEAVTPQHAPVPQNRSERVVFAQLYETLVNVACDGTITPGLAKLWTCTNDSTTWVFTLRDDARFWDGTRVTADHVRLAWAHNQMAGTDNYASPWSWIDAQAGSITTVDARRLAIQLPEPQAKFPLLLAHPAAAISIDQPGWTWPIGSGPSRLRASDPAPRPDLVLLPNLQHPTAPIWKSLTFTVKAGLDPRDFVTTNIDLAFTRSLSTVDFFDAAPNFQTTPLPWDQLVLLICPPEMNPRGNAGWTRAIERLNVVQDVTGVSLRPWNHLLFPVGGSQYCPQLSGPIASQSAVSVSSQLAHIPLDQGTIAFAEDEVGSGELAARLSHLMGPQVHATGLPDADLVKALQWQMVGAVLVVQDQLFPTGCLQMATLMGRAAWLQKAGLAKSEPGPAENLVQAHTFSANDRRSPALEFGASGIVQPIALGRGWLITRSDLAGLRLSFDGTPLLSGLGRATVAQVSP